MRTVFLENSGRRKFAQLVTNHVLGHEDGDECFAVVHIESVANEVRRDGAAAGPGLDGFLCAGFVDPVDLVEELPLHKRAFFQ